MGIRISGSGFRVPQRFVGQFRLAGNTDTSTTSAHLRGNILTKPNAPKRLRRLFYITRTSSTCWMMFEAVWKHTHSGASPLQVLESHASSLFRREQVLQDRGHQLHDAHLGEVCLELGLARLILQSTTTRKENICLNFDARV